MVNLIVKGNMTNLAILGYGEMRVITLHQPWASLVALGLKRYETRSWATNYRGKLLIHAAKKNVSKSPFQSISLFSSLEKSLPEELKNFVLDAHQLPVGCIVAIADLTNCLLMESHPRMGIYYREKGEFDVTLHAQGRSDAIIIETVSELDRAVGNWSTGRVAWKLENIAELPIPIFCKGKQGLWVPSKENMEVL